MSGFIRVKRLQTRYEVGCEVYWDETEAVSALAEARGPERSNDFNLTIIRRWKVKRTEVVEERSERATFYDAARGLVICCWLSTADAKWVVTPEDCACPRPENQRIPTREEAEAVARAWLDANGYRLKRAK